MHDIVGSASHNRVHFFLTKRQLGLVVWIKMTFQLITLSVSTACEVRNANGMQGQKSILSFSKQISDFSIFNFNRPSFRKNKTEATLSQ